MADSKSAAAFISDGAPGSSSTLTGLDIRRCLTPLLFNGTSRAFGTRSGRRPGAGGVPTISGTTVSIPAGSAVVDSGSGNLDPPFLVSWGSGVPTLAGTPADSSQPRVDLVYVRVDEVLGSPTVQTITFGYQAGAASSSPVPPTTLSDSTAVGRVCVLGYINVPASGGGAATVTAGPVVVPSGGVLPVDSSAQYPTAANCVDGTVLWNKALGEFVVLRSGAWSVRETTVGPKVQSASSSVTASSLGTGSIAFGSSFPGIPVVVASAASAGGGFTSVQIGTTTVSGFDYRIRDNTGSVIPNGNVTINWVAVYQ